MNVDEIPSRKVREVRPCFGDDADDCVFAVADDCSEYCNLHHREYFSIEHRYALSKQRPEKCPDNFYPDEMQALLNDRNVKDFLCYL